MRKSDIVRLVFISILTIAAIICCVLSISVRVSLEKAGENVEGAAEGLGFAFAAAFGMIIAILYAIAGMVAGLISILIAAFGLRAPVLGVRITFIVLLVVDAALILTTAIGTFAGL